VLIRRRRSHLHFILAIASIACASAESLAASCDVNLASSLFVPITGPLGGVVVDDSCEHVYLTNTGLNRVEVFSLQTLTLQTPIQVGSSPAGLAITPDGSLLYVANSGGNNISVVDVAHGVELRKISVPSNFSNDRPYSIAIANNGLALFSTTFAGSGFGARVMQLRLTTDQVMQRTDFWYTGTTTEETTLKASGDRSTIGIVAGDISSGPVFRYSAETDAFSLEKDLAAFISDVSLDATGSTLLVTPGAYVLDADLSLSGTIQVDVGWGGNAVDPNGLVGYRSVAARLDVLNLSTFLKMGELPLGDSVNDAYVFNPIGRIGISDDGTLLAVMTDHGFSIVRSGWACGPDGTPCNDLDTCTTNDACSAGLCVGVAVNCDDGDPCTADRCDAVSRCASQSGNMDESGFSAARIDGRDAVVLADAWNSCPDDPAYNPAANLDQVGCVDLIDFHLFMTTFGRSCAAE